MIEYSKENRVASYFSNLRNPKTIALLCLLASGLTLGVTTNLAKLAPQLGIAPLPYLVWSLCGATLLLWGFAVLRQKALVINRRTLEYFVVAGFLTTAGANLILFNAVTRLGVSFVAMMITLPPLFTYGGALLLRMERFSWRRAAGVGIAIVGTTLLVAERWGAEKSNLPWILLTLTAPILLAAGNLYRTYRWPPNASSESLAPGMLAAATAMLFGYATATDVPLNIPPHHASSLLLILFQATIFTAQFLLMFALQKSGGPVLLSLMGGVSAMFGVPIAMGLYGEPLPPIFLIAAAMVTAGTLGLLFSQNIMAGKTPISCGG